MLRSREQQTSPECEDCRSDAGAIDIVTAVCRDDERVPFQPSLCQAVHRYRAHARGLLPPRRRRRHLTRTSHTMHPVDTVRQSSTEASETGGEGHTTAVAHGPRTFGPRVWRRDCRHMAPQGRLPIPRSCRVRGPFPRMMCGWACDGACRFFWMIQAARDQPCILRCLLR